MPSIRRGISEQASRAIIIGDEDVDATVVIYVAENRGPANLDEFQGRTGRIRHILEALPLAKIADQHVPFAVGIGLAGLIRTQYPRR